MPRARVGVRADNDGALAQQQPPLGKVGVDLPEDRCRQLVLLEQAAELQAKAVTATARKIAVLYYNAMRFGMNYKDPGATHYEQKYRDRVIKQLHRRAAEFGFSLQENASVS